MFKILILFKLALVAFIMITITD